MSNPAKKNSVFTYNEGRKCRWCGKPLADQDHATRIYCEAYYDEFGKVRDCKSDYHTAKNEAVRKIHSTLIRDHKYFAKQITSIISKKGYEVSTDDLNAYDIILSDSIKSDIKKDGTGIFQFLQYKITSDPTTNTHKITPYE